MRTLWPAYVWPGNDDEWRQALAALQPGDIAVINPSDGPGTETNGAWQDRIEQLHERSVFVAGYIATGYGTRDWRACVSQAAQYHALDYDVQLIFWDEVAGTEPLGVLKGLHGFSRSLMPRGAGYSVFNLGVPHTATTRAYAGMLNGSIWITFESPAEVYPKPVARQMEAHLVYSASGLDEGRITAQAERDGIGWLYVTPDTMQNPWDSWKGNG